MGGVWGLVTACRAESAHATPCLTPSSPQHSLSGHSHLMKRHAALFLYVVLGAIVSIAIYWFSVFIIVEPLRARSGRSPESYLGLAYLIMLPLALVLGSALTGFLSYPHLKTKLGLIATAPGLYFFVLFTATNFWYGEFGFAVSMLFAGLVWFLVSWAGTSLGYYLRTRQQRK